ncbi:MAG: DUF4114 domain-containing protein [Scytonematopsis contorta HA4267-MV1]|jgi:RHS repeat-associated protein|nr:DUF4114 domain-containing protein [Scytonematopsis contorta HA4267-MV1]
MENFNSISSNDLFSTTLNISQSILSNPLNTSDIFTIPGKRGSLMTLNFEWIENNAAFDNEVGVFVVDKLGKVGGIAPGEEGYAQAAINDASSQIIFSHRQEVGTQRQLTFQAEDTLGFYLIQNDSTKDWLTSNSSNSISNGPIAFFSIDGVNPDKFDHIQGLYKGGGVQQFRWEDSTFGGDRDFNDVVFNVSAVRPAVLVPGESGEIVPVTFNKVSQEASFQNEMGLFVVDNAQGRIGSILPGQPGYIEAALSDSRRDIIFASGQTSGTAKTMELPAKSYVGFYLIQNATTERFLNQNPQNELNREPLAFFFFPQGNPDSIDHLQDIAANSFGWEDLTNGGDKDFNDLVFEYTFGIPRVNSGSGGNIQLSINASLANDTGVSDSDKITVDPTINGQAIGATSLQGNLNNSGFVDISNALSKDGNFTISLEQYDILSNSFLPDGDYILELKVGNDSGAKSDVLTVSFSLERTPPPLDFNLALQSDTGELGDGITSERKVNLVGQTLPGLKVVLVKTQQMVTADSEGNFSFTDVPMPIAGTAPFSIATVDIAGNIGRLQKQFTRIGINGAPKIISTPETVFDTDKKETYIYQIEAIDPDNDTLTYSLLNGLKGSEIDERGLLTFKPGSTLSPSYNFSIEVSDGRGGTDTQAFTVKIPALANLEKVNQDPFITSTPITQAIMGQPYEYLVRANDPDGDTLTFNLNQAPEGMVINPQTGQISYTPIIIATTSNFDTSDSQIRPGTDNQATFTDGNRGINFVNPIGDYAVGEGFRVFSNLPVGPVFRSVVSFDLRSLSSQVTSAKLQLLKNRTSGDPIETLGLFEVTTNTSQLYKSGLVSPEIFEDLGTGRSYGTFDVATGGNSNEILEFKLNEAAIAAINAANENFFSIGLALLSANPNNATEAAEYLFAFSNSSGIQRLVLETDNKETVSILVSDGKGGEATQNYTLNIVESSNNQAPIITSSPEISIALGETYEYQVEATDPNNDPLSYSLIKAPDGLEIDNLGKITWNPTKIGEFELEIQVSDSKGAVDTQVYTLKVLKDLSEDTEAPQVQIGFNRTVFKPGETLNLEIQGFDNVGLADLDLFFNGNSLVLNPNTFGNDLINATSVTLNNVGVFEVLATATDLAGNIDKKAISIRVIDPNDTTAPITEIDLTQFQENSTLIDAPTNIIGTINDDNLEYYRLEIAPVNLVDLNNPAAADLDYRVLAEGNTNIKDGVIGQVDPRFLANDSYFLRVITQDFSGNINAKGLVVAITGELKPGRFTQEFVDLSVPLAGLPIEVNRVYDSLQSNQIGDFGYGWSLGVQDARITESVPVTDRNALSLFTSTPFQVGSTVTLTNPEGRRVTFTFQPVITKVNLLGAIWSPRFVAEPGVFDKLEVDNISLSIRSDGTAGLFLFGFPYNPSKYRLTTKDGTTYQYDQFDGLIDIRDRNGNSLTYTDAGIFSSTGESVKFRRDAKGRITEIIDPAGKLIKYDYNANGDLVSVTDRNGNTNKLVYKQPQLPHYLTEVIDPLGRSGIRSEYNEEGQLVRIIDADGNALDLNFNSAASSQTVKDPLGNNTTFVFDKRGNIVQEVDAEGGITLNTYDDDNNLISITDPRGNTTTFTYDDRSNQLTQTDALGNTTTLTYNDLNQILTVTDAKGNVTTNRYDSRGNLLEREDAVGNVTRYDYFANGNLRTLTDANNNKTNYRYDTLGRLTEVEDAIRAVIRFTYDSIGNIKSITTPLGNTTTFGYNAEGQLVKVTDAKGNITQIEYNAAGDRTATIDALGRRTEFVYNNRGLQTQIRYADGTVSQTAYDALDRVVKEIDQNGNKIEFEYDGLARLISVVDALGNKTQYGYDASSNQITQTDALGRTTKFEYDALNRLTETQLPLGQTETRTYNAVNKLTSLTNFKGEIITYEYDPNNMLSALRLPDAPDEIYTYTPTGEISTITDARGTTKYEYDKLDQLVRRTEPNEVAIAYTYDLDGNINALNTPTGTVNYTYDKLGLLETVTDRQNKVTTYSYDLVGNLIKTKLANGIVETRQYDLLNRPIFIENINSNGNIISSYRYTLDDFGNRLLLEENTGRRVEYSYDDLYRLTQETVTDTINGNKTTNYVYDNVGNRLSRISIIDGTTTYTYDDNDRLLTETNDGIVTNYSYDDAGNLITTTTDGETQLTYTWNSKGKLSKAVVTENATEQTIEFQYNTDGIRAATTVDGKTTNFLIDKTQQEFAQVIEEYGAGNTSVIYTYGLDLISQQRNRETSFYHTDALGSVRLLTDISGNVLNTYLYDPYGSVINQLEMQKNAYKFTGEQFDNELANYYLRARYYNPATGRFVSRDSFAGFNKRPLSLSDYLYAEGNPINAIDPSGEVAVLSYNRLLTSPINQAAFKTIAKLQAFGSANLLFIGNVLNGANNANGRSDDFLEIALSQTEEELNKIKKIVKLIAKVAPKPLGKAINSGFETGAKKGIEYIEGQI